ncbi:hypothetical protein L1887_53557 [Cichorium endivia]|nr:hypothetical protein L1887_53557 [Cichorium endivia]
MKQDERASEVADPRCRKAENTVGLICVVCATPANKAACPLCLSRIKFGSCGDAMKSAGNRKAEADRGWGATPSSPSRISDASSRIGLAKGATIPKQRRSVNRMPGSRRGRTAEEICVDAHVLTRTTSCFSDRLPELVETSRNSLEEAVGTLRREADGDEYRHRGSPRSLEDCSDGNGCERQ